MKKRNVLIVLLVLALVILALIWWGLFRDGGAKDGSDESADEELTTEQIQEGITKCEKEKAYFQAQCFQDLAIKAKDPDMCKRVSDIKDVGYAESFYIIHEGVCLALVSRELNYDATLCERVKADADQYELCTGYAAQLHATDAKNPEFCEVVDHGNMWYGNCLAGSVAAESDIGVCDKASGYYKEVCRDQAYMNLADENQDISYCDKVKESSDNAICKANYAKDVGDLNVCHTLGSDKSMCICYNMYFDELNDSACAALSDETQKANCQKCVKMNLFK